ncbi:hypothetical protein [Labrys neptuniae]
MSVTALRQEAPEPVAKTDEPNIALLMETDPSIVIREPEKLLQLYTRIDADIAAQVPDLTTDKGRKAIASLAFKIARTKTAVEGAAKKMTEDFRKATDEVNSTRNAIVESLATKQKLARKPLTDWEDAEEERVKRVNDDIAAFRSAASIPMGMTATELAERIEDLKRQEIDPAVFQDRYDEAVATKAASVAAMVDAHGRLVKAEAEAAELECLREAQGKRDFADRILEHIRQARVGMIGGQPYGYAMIIHELQNKVQASEVAPEYQERVETARVEALAFVNQAHEEAQRRRETEAKEEQERRDKEAAEVARLNAIAETERKAREETEALARKQKAELDRIAQEQAQQEAEARRIKAEADKRAADKAHRADVMRAVKEALMEAGEIDEPTAKQIVMALVSGSIPHTTITF